MPKLSPNDPAILALGLEDRSVEQSRGIQPYLPDIETMSLESGGLPVIHQDLAAGWAFATGWQMQRGTQMTFGAIVTNVGIPTTKIFRDVVEVIGTDVNAPLDEAAGLIAELTTGEDPKDVLEKVIMMGIGFGVDLMSAVPVAGAIVNMVWEAGKMIKTVIELAVSQSREEARKLFPTTRFNPSADALAYNQRILKPTKDSKDWTDIFSPPGWGPGSGWQSLFSISHLAGGGKRIMTTNPTWLGFVPGSGWLHQAIEVDTNVGTIDPGQYLPTARDQGSWLWKHVQKGNLPSMFTVDAAAARVRWERYLMDLWVTLWETKDLSDGEKQKAWDLLTDANEGAVMRLAKPRVRGGRLKWQKPDDKYLRLLLPIHELNVLEKRQKGYLDTVTVAYLDKSYAAIGGNKDMRDKWEKRRGQLLTHPARCQVSLADVSDPVYEAKLRDVGVGTPRCLPARFKAIVGFETTPPRMPKPQPGLPGSLREAIPAPSRRRRSAIVPLAAAAAAAGGLWYLAKRRR